MAMLKLIKHHELAKAAVFGLLSGVFVFFFVLGLVNNGNGAVERYDTLIAVDKAGGDVNIALDDLRTFIYGHMNTEIGGTHSIYPPIQLSGTYERLVSAEETRVESINDNLYAEAQSYCERTSPEGFSGRNRLQCINKYIDDKGAKVFAIDDSFYKYDFVAPRWSPDLAGFSLLAFIVSAVLTLFNLFMYIRTKHIVHMGN